MPHLAGLVGTVICPRRVGARHSGVAGLEWTGCECQGVFGDGPVQFYIYLCHIGSCIPCHVIWLSTLLFHGLTPTPAGPVRWRYWPPKGPARHSDILSYRVLPRVFSAGMKIVIDKNLENTVWQCFWSLFNKGFMIYICIFKAFGVLLILWHFKMD
jgi:hypothetical protein